MKQYLLLLRSSDFLKNGNIWESSPINVYANSSYYNYSYKRSNYGLNLSGDSVYTGLEITSPSLESTSSLLENSIYVTDVGEVVYEEATPSLLRFIDTTSRVDILSYRHVFTGIPGDQVPTFSIKIYESDTANGPWLKSIDSGEARAVYVKDVKSYIKISLDISSEIEDLSILGLVFYLELVIYDSSIPVISESAKNILRKFPSWTALYADSVSQATPSLYVPESTGAKFINALVQESLDSFRNKIDTQYLESTISGANENALDWVWATYSVPANVIKVIGDGVVLARTGSFEEFSSLTNEDYAYYYNIIDRQLVTTRKFDSLFIDANSYGQSPILLYNQFDEFGVRVGLQRLHLESNANYKLRILDVYKNPPSVDQEGLKLTLRRELDIWRAYGSIPDSNYQGATPEILEIQDLENSTPYFSANGKPLPAFIDLVENLNTKYPANIGYVSWEDGIWDYAGLLGEGVSRIPAMYDGATPLGRYFNPGVGDFNDARFSSEVDPVDNVHFNVILKAYGIKEDGEEDVYTSIRIPYEYYLTYSLVRSQSNKGFDPDISSISLCYEIEVKPHDNYSLSKTFYANLNPSDRSDLILHNAHLETSEASPEFNYIKIFDSNGYTVSSIQFRDKVTDEPYLNTSTEPPFTSINIADIQSVTAVVNVGGWNQGSQSYDSAVSPQNRISFSLSTPNYYVNLTPAQSLSLTTPNISPLNSNLLVGSTLYTSISETLRSNVFSKEIILNSQNSTDISSLEGATINIYDEIDNIIYPSGAMPLYLNITPTYSFEAKVGGYTINPQNAEETFIPATPSIVWQAYDVFDSEVSTPGYFTSIEADLSGSIDKVVISSNTSNIDHYPLKRKVLTNFEIESPVLIEGYLDRFGNFYNNNELEIESTLFNKYINKDSAIQNISVDRSTFEIENDPDTYTFSGIEVVSSNDKVDISTNFDIRDIGKYELVNNSLSVDGYEQELAIDIAVHANRNEENIRKVSTSIEPGWIYLNDEQYYIYSKPVVEAYSGRLYEILLQGVPRGGSPVIVTVDDVEYRRVPDFGESEFGRKSEIVYGNYSNNLYLSYEDVYDANVRDAYTGKIIFSGLTSSTSELPVFNQATPSVIDREYQVDYRINNSYYLHKDFYDENQDEYVGKIAFFATPSYDVEYKIIYESDSYESATPIALRIDPANNPLTEGYVYASVNQYDFSGVTAVLSPNYIIDSQDDIMYMTIVSYDVNGNPKPYQAFEIHGDLIESSPQYILTNSNGFGMSRVRYIGPVPAEEYLGRIIIDGISLGDYYRLVESGEVRITEDGQERVVDWPIDEQIYSFVNSDSESYTKFVDFHIALAYSRPVKVKASVDKPIINADGVSSQFIFGRITNQNVAVGAGISVFWRKSRDIKDLLSNQAYQGYVVTDLNGRFVIGPIVSEDKSNPGYWFVSVETDNDSSIVTPDSSGTIAGDIVYWYEQYDNIHYENESLPLGNNIVVAPDTDKHLAATPNFVYKYTDLSQISYLSATPNWNPPMWLPIDRYTQYQMGLFGSTPNFVQDYSRIRPDYQED